VGSAGQAGSGVDRATVCYMTDQAEGPVRVGVRELRQNLSVYLDRIKGGETLEVTEHGHAVALLAPLPRTTRSTLERLVAEGRVTPGVGDLLAFLRANPAPARPEPSTPATAPHPRATPVARTTSTQATAMPRTGPRPPSVADQPVETPEIDREPSMTEILHRMQEGSEL
jgi:antitoxin (DNA-binding transcriptional repressor) of toxin-antitoxin stability system